MKRLEVWLWLLAIGLGPVSPESKELSVRVPQKGYDFQVSEEDPNSRWVFEVQQLVDPVTGKIPDGIRQKELNFLRTHLVHPTNFRQLSLNWQFAGPRNVGGRTRAAALDLKNDQIIMAAGVSGGLWKSLDGGLNWARTTDPLSRNSITALAQDTREGNTNTWYYGTGELRGNSASVTGIVPFRGNGIYKSTDNGDSWESLPATATTPTTFNSAFQYVHGLATSEKLGMDEIYAAVYGGLVVSKDGGTSWEQVLGKKLFDLPEPLDINDTLVSRYSAIFIEKDQGYYYAALSGETPNLQVLSEDKGYYFSADGDSWFKITPPSLSISGFGRTVIDARGNTAYFLSAIQGISKLFRLQITGVKMDGEPEGFWEDLSENLPAFGGNLGDYSTQTNYNMLVKIDPDDTNIVYLGGRNLWRSSDGFQTRDKIAWIGGYNPADDFSLYENHHPDQHELLFPASRAEVLSFNDGGVWSSTNYQSADSVTWRDLNNGYITTQFYTVALPKDVSTDFIVGGLQDNGTHFTISPESASPWIEALSGDGGFAAFTDQDLYRYHSTQRGQTFRFTYNEAQELTSFTRVDPDTGTAGGSNLFITPYVLDPSNNNVMYFAGGSRLWRNSNLAQIPTGSNDPTLVNWELLNTPETDFSITALEATAKGERLYFGTSAGEFFRLDDPSSSPSSAAFRLGQSDLPDFAYISCIASNPENPDEVMVVLSNYGIVSLFHSLDGGVNFVRVAGDLEENTDGTGDGPSLRWAEIVPMANGGKRYFVGTSVGLFSTDTLDLFLTRWARESPDKIGSSVVRMMDYRPRDGRLVVATHGNGVYKTTVEGFKTIRKPASDAALAVVSVFPNPLKQLTSIQYSVPETDFVRVDIFDSEGNTVKNLFLGPQFAGDNTLTWDGSNTAGYPVDNGLYFYRIVYDRQKLTGKILVNR